MPRSSLTVIVTATILALFLAIMIDAGLESFNKVLIVGALLVMSLSSLFIARFIVLPNLARDAKTPRPNIITVGCSESMVPATLAVIGAIFVNEFWVAVAGGALGVVSWLVVSDYFCHLPVDAGSARS